MSEKKISAISGQRLARRSLATIEALKIGELFHLISENTLKKCSKCQKVVKWQKKIRKRTKQNYSISALAVLCNVYYPDTPREKFKKISYKVVNYFIAA